MKVRVHFLCTGDVQESENKTKINGFEDTLDGTMVFAYKNISESAPKRALRDLKVHLRLHLSCIYSCTCQRARAYRLIQSKLNLRGYYILYYRTHLTFQSKEHLKMQKRMKKKMNLTLHFMIHLTMQSRVHLSLVLKINLKMHSVIYVKM